MKNNIVNDNLLNDQSTVDVGDFGTLQLSEVKPDGSTVYDFAQKEKDDFYSDLSRKMSEDSLNKLSSYIISALEDDIKARDGYILSLAAGMGNVYSAAIFESM